MEKTVKSIAINYGLYLGGFLSLFTVAVYAIDLNLMSNMWLGIGIFAIIIGMGIFSTSKVKSAFEGYLSFKEAFSAYFITTIVGIAISSILTFILYTIIDPDAAEEIKKITIEATISMMEGFNTPPDIIAQQIEELEKTEQFSIVNSLKSLAFQAVFQAVIGLIVAAVMKKSNVEA